MPEDFRAFRFLQKRDAVAPENVEAAFHMFEGFERRMQAVPECVGLQQLGADRGAKEQSFRTAADKVAKYFRERAAEIHFPLAALRFQVGLQLSGFRLHGMLDEARKQGSTELKEKLVEFAGSKQTIATANLLRFLEVGE